MKALIFCCGSAGRWTGPVPKQLVEVDGEPLLYRTVRQLGARGVECTIVATDPQFTVPKAKMFSPQDTRWLVESILSTRDLWAGDMLVVLGDVVFTEAAMDTITSARGMHWYGRADRSPITGGCGEVFAMSFDPDTASRFAEGMQVGLNMALDSGEGRDRAGSPMGSVWQPYRHLESLPLGVHSINRSGDVWVEVSDFTDDYDSYDHYLNWTKRWARRWIKQGPPPKLESLEAPQLGA